MPTTMQNPFYAMASNLKNITMGLINSTSVPIAAPASNPYSAATQASIFPSSYSNAAVSGAGGNPIQIAAAQIGKNEADGSYKEFSQGRAEAWCADFASWVWEKANGGTCPWGYNGGRNYKAGVVQIKDWAVQNGCYAQQKTGDGIKPGDCIIFGSSGSQHIGIVEKIDPDGTIHTIEGNTSDKVARRSYPPGHSNIHGFVKMDKYRQGQSMIA